MESVPTDKLPKVRPPRAVVLCLNGAFNPPHLEHVAMMEEAKRIAEAQGLKVVGGYLSPSSDRYVSEKKGDWAAWLGLRAKMCAEAVKESNWLMATNLGIASQKRAAGAVGKVTALPVYVVMGSDVGERFSKGMKGSIVVDRKGWLSSSRIIEHSKQKQWEAVAADLHPGVFALWKAFCDEWDGGEAAGAGGKERPPGL